MLFPLLGLFLQLVWAQSKTASSTSTTSVQPSVDPYVNTNNPYPRVLYPRQIGPNQVIYQSLNGTDLGAQSQIWYWMTLYEGLVSWRVNATNRDAIQRGQSVIRLTPVRLVERAPGSNETVSEFVFRGQASWTPLSISETNLTVSNRDQPGTALQISTSLIANLTNAQGKNLTIDVSMLLTTDTFEQDGLVLTPASALITQRINNYPFKQAGTQLWLEQSMGAAERFTNSTNSSQVFVGDVGGNVGYVLVNQTAIAGDGSSTFPIKTSISGKNTTTISEDDVLAVPVSSDPFKPPLDRQVRLLSLNFDAPNQPASFTFNQYIAVNLTALLDNGQQETSNAGGVKGGSGWWGLVLGFMFMMWLQ